MKTAHRPAPRNAARGAKRLPLCLLNLFLQVLCCVMCRQVYDFPNNASLFDFNRHFGYTRWRVNLVMFKGEGARRGGGGEGAARAHNVLYTETVGADPMSNRVRSRGWHPTSQHVGGGAVRRGAWCPVWLLQWHAGAVCQRCINSPM